VKRAFLAATLLAAFAAATTASAYEGDDETEPPAYGEPHPAPGYGEYPPRGGYPAPLSRYGGTFGSRDGAFPPPHAARPPAPGYMPHAGAPDLAGSVEAARRLYTVADTVALAGAPLCKGRVRAHSGMRTWSRDNMGPQAPQVARQQRLDHSIAVFAVARNGPAEKAGLRPGDTITAVNGESIPAMAGAMSIYAARMESALAQGRTVLVGYLRDGQRHEARIEPAQACDYRIVFSNSPMVNAATDGRSVTVMRGLMNVLSRDDELALVVGHELGHNVLGHFQRGRMLGHQAGPFGAGAQFSMRAFEREADHIGLYFVALAGYDPEAAIQSSRKMAAQSPMGDRGSATHPSQAERYAGLQAALREIRGKLAEGQTLAPGFRAAADPPPRGRRGAGDLDRRLPIQ
jgi:hypothetical protein